MITYPVVEKFVSINGEGTRAGELAVFIRFRGCNLNCSYCDTKWANSCSAEAEMLTCEQITEYVKSTGVINVTLTGGEPLLQDNLEALINSLADIRCRVEIETNGSVPIKKYTELENRPVITMDYKLPSSNSEKYMLSENFEYLSYCDTVKLVAGSIGDLLRGAEIIEEHRLTEKCFVYFSPVFDCIEPSEIVEFMKIRKLNDVRLQLQLHKYIWNPEKRGV